MDWDITDEIDATTAEGYMLKDGYRFCEACDHPIPTHQTEEEHAAICDAQG
jgi:hypothetical protein